VSNSLLDVTPGSGARLGRIVPIISAYLKIEAPAARYLERSCNAGIGLPAVVYYSYHGVFISLDMTDSVALGIHVPAGNTARLEGNRVRITGTTHRGAVDVSLPIRAAPQGALGAIDPPQVRGYPDPFTSPDYFGPLQGASRDGHNAWYFFIAETDPRDGPVRTLSTPRGLERGTIELPPLTINGQHYEPQVLHFERHRHVELMPVNC
jgi:hypothetical protein